MIDSQVVTAAKPDEQQVLDAFRRWGYLEAELDPLGRIPTSPFGQLDLEGEAADRGRRFYCGPIAVEFMHIPDPKRRHWIQERMESEAPEVDSERILDRLMRAEIFEQMIQSRYLGSKRFSIEGVTAIIPFLEEVLNTAADLGATHSVMAMSHRGRLNVMTHVVGVPFEHIFAGFEDVDPKSVLGGGDVKYHMGATGTFQTAGGREVHMHLASNPSHLEAVDPVAIGRVRAKQTRLGDNERTRVVPIILHGDSAFAGQGVLAEALNLAEIDGFSVGGTVHVIVNNLIGFTTEPHAYGSTRFATDVALRLPIPIFHVNGEDLAAVARTARLAAEYRYAFGSEVVVDVIGYRRHGHSEIDDPTITQPKLYRALKDHPPLWQIYAERIGLSAEEREAKVQAIRDDLEQAHKKAGSMEKKPALAHHPEYWDEYQGGLYDPAYEVDTGVDAATLGAVAQGLVQVPDGFDVHPKVQKLLELRAEMGAGNKPVDYGMAEALAFGSLLEEGVPVRLSGQDSRRGTFNQRHAVLIDVQDESEVVPLAGLAQGGAFFEVYDSMLSEAAVMGFEYGFSRDYPETLVLWEAQFGDFVNGAQIIIDQFVSAAEDKWGLLSGLVLLLPHGYEGQGPEHSSARVERFLALAAEDNMQICQPSTAGQYFHLLRRQALRSWRKPLVVFTPKSMLRHRDSASELAVFEAPRFRPVVADPKIENAQRILICSGKIGHEMIRQRQKLGDDTTAVFFLDQFYPFPKIELQSELEKHPEARQLIWVQEEPANMGGLEFVIPRLRHSVSDRLPVSSIKRSASASPSTGSAKAHAIEQRTLLELAFPRKTEEG
ncbi:MAG: 2-oxoglutarate dehydrogenase E1 component [Acidobacteriota bacterium]